MKQQISDETKRRLALGLTAEPVVANVRRRRRKLRWWKSEAVVVAVCWMLVGQGILAAVVGLLFLFITW